MRTIRNKTNRPLRVPLPRGKTLHLGPRKEGQIATHDIDHPPLQKMIEAGDIELLGETSEVPEPREGGHVHDDTHGRAPEKTIRKRGDR